MCSFLITERNFVDGYGVLQVLRRLDNIDEGVRQFFLPASKAVLESGDPEDALSRALAALSGLVEVPKPRRSTTTHPSTRVA